MRPDALAQYFLELVNRARLDPVGESARLKIPLNQELNPGTILAKPMQPLAWNQQLNDAAVGHTAWMLTNKAFSHTGAGGSQPLDRMLASNYGSPNTFYSGENIGWSNEGGQDFTLKTRVVYEDLYASGAHRLNLLADFFRETGVSVATGTYLTPNAAISAQDFTLKIVDDQRFVTGVAYTDKDADKFYTPGEGVANVTVKIARADGTSDTTAAAGGYVTSFTQNGGAVVTFSGTGLSAPASVSLQTGADNIKLDLINGTTVQSSASLDLLSGVNSATLLGAGALRLNGNSAANILTGNRAANRLDGRGGADTMRGGAGNDVYVVDNASDRVTETAEQGSDTVLASVSYTVSLQIERLTLTGKRNIAATGSAAADTLTGNAGANFLKGQGGNDRLLGAAGSDLLLGARGAGERDTLIGGTGDDTFILATPVASLYTGTKSSDFALIQDFTPGVDHLQLKGAAVDYLVAQVAVGAVKGTGLFLDSNANGSLQQEQDELIAIFSGAAKSKTQLLAGASYV